MAVDEFPKRLKAFAEALVDTLQLHSDAYVIFA